MEAPCDLRTWLGIGIGSTYEQTVKAYKDYIDKEMSDKARIVAGSIYGGVIFSFDSKGKVNGIFIGAAAE
jgi:ribose 5-phosphate isomerase